MDVEIYARIKPTRYSNEAVSSIEHENNVIVANSSHDSRVSFGKVFDDGSSSIELYRTCAEPMIDLLIAGYNVSMLFVGAQGSGRSYTLAGADETARSTGTEEREGVMQLLLPNLFDSIGLEQRTSDAGEKEASVSISMIEMNAGGHLTDLISRKRLPHDIQQTASRGYMIKNLVEEDVSSPDEAHNLFRQGWRSRTQTARQTSTFIIYINLSMSFNEFPEPHSSRMSLVVMPCIDDMNNSVSEISKIENVVSQLARQRYPERLINYKHSPITKLLTEELGGNCSTRVLALFQKNGSIASQLNLLKLCRNLSKVKNFPIQNDTFARQLITQYRTHVIDLDTKLEIMERQPPISSQEDHILRNENSQLRDEISRLKLKLEQVNNTYGAIASNKSELSAQLVHSEEEKLRAHKSYIELQIFNNKLKEELEANNYENTSKILNMQHDYQLLMIERTKFQQELETMRAQFGLLEADRKNLADEFVKLKKSYMGLSDDCQREANKNEELTMELLNLINAKSVLTNMAAQSSKFKEETDALLQEQDRIRKVVNRLSGPQMQMAKELWNSHKLETDLLSSQQRYTEQSNNLKHTYNESIRSLEENIEKLKKELKAARDLARERQQKISFLNARLITLSGEHEECKTLNNRLQHKIKDINEEYKLRLTKYVHDISLHVDNTRKGKDREKAEESIAEYVNKLIKEIKTAHRNREEQLSQAAQEFKNRTEKVVRRHEELLCAYRDLRCQVQDAGFNEHDLGPDEHELMMSDADLHSSQQREILRLQSDAHRRRIGDSVQDFDNIALSKESKPLAGILRKSTREIDETFGDLNSWTAVRFKIRQFAQTSLKELEEERASLLSKNTLLEEQLRDAQSYIDNHLARYKDEIDKLRQQLARR